MTTSQKPVLIIGAGLGGLTLAQILRKQNLPFRIFERDVGVEARTQGWAISLQWIRKYLVEAMPDDLGPLSSVNVQASSPIVGVGAPECDKQAHIRMFDGKTGEMLVEMPNSLRASRAKFRNYLEQHLDIEWNKKFTKYVETPDGVTAYFEDGTTAEGSLLIGFDGSRSHVREQLLLPLPNPPVTTFAPFGLVVGETPLTKADYSRVSRELSPTLSFSAINGTRLMNGILSAEPLPADAPDDAIAAHTYHFLVWPEPSVGTHTAAETDKVRAEYWTQTATKQQLWEYQQNATREFTDSQRTIVKATKPEHMVSAPALYNVFAPPAALPAPSDIPVDSDNYHEGVRRVTLAGDAAHAMVPFRGEGANNALLDAIFISNALLTKSVGGEAVSGEEVLQAENIERALRRYEAEMLPRGTEAVLRSGTIALGSDSGAQVYQNIASGRETSGVDGTGEMEDPYWKKALRNSGFTV